MTPKYRILDLDNCISDDSWRIKTIDWSKSKPKARYHKYHTLCGFDEAKNHELFQDLGETEGIVIFTARPQYVEIQTREWLKRNVAPFCHLFMRPNNSDAGSADLKEQFLHSFAKYFPLSLDSISVAYDDRQEVIDMYRSYGVNAIRKEIHQQNAFKKDK